MVQRPADGGGKRVAGARHVDGVHFARGQVLDRRLRRVAIGEIHAFAAAGDDHLARALALHLAAGGAHVKRRGQGARHARFQLAAVEDQQAQARQVLRQVRHLRLRDGNDDQWRHLAAARAGVLACIGQQGLHAVVAQVQVAYGEGGGRALRLAAVQKGGRQLFVQLHVGHRQQHFAMLVEYGGVGAAAGIAQMQAAAHVDAGLFRMGLQGMAGRVIAQRRQQGDGQRQAGQVFRDIAAHAAKHLFRAHGIGRTHLQSGEGAHLAVQVGGADAQHGAAVGQHIGAPQQAAFTDQSGDMAGDGRARQAQFARQFLLRDEGVVADQRI